MNQIEAVSLANKYREELKGRTFDNNPAWTIQDVIFCSSRHVGQVYEKMWQANIGNVEVLSHFPSAGEEYEVYVISHQWPWGSGNLLFERLETYLKANAI